jgi:hypothetical protein
MSCEYITCMKASFHSCCGDFECMAEESLHD